MRSKLPRQDDGVLNNHKCVPHSPAHSFVHTTAHYPSTHRFRYLALGRVRSEWLDALRTHFADPHQPLDAKFPVEVLIGFPRQSNDQTAGRTQPVRGGLAARLNTRDSRVEAERDLAATAQHAFEELVLNQHTYTPAHSRVHASTNVLMCFLTHMRVLTPSYTHAYAQYMHSFGQRHHSSRYQKPQLVKNLSTHFRCSRPSILFSTTSPGQCHSLTLMVWF